MTPVRIDLLIVVGLGGGGTSVRVHGDVVRAQKSTAEPAIVSTGVLLVNADNHQTLLRGLDELVAAGAILVRDLISALLFTIMVPPYLLIRQYFRHFYETSQMHRLAPRNNQLPFADAAIANVGCAVRYILKKPTREKSKITSRVAILSQTCNLEYSFIRFSRNFILKYSAKLNFDSPAAQFLFFIFSVKVFRFTEGNEFAVTKIYDAYKTGANISISKLVCRNS